MSASPPTPLRFAPLPWGVTGAVSAFVLLVALLPPFVGPGVRFALMDGFHVVCHQLPERSFAVGGVPMALCHRCTGVLAGLVLGVLLLPLLGSAVRRLAGDAWRLLAFALVPLVFDWGLGALGLWANTPFSRVATGALFGFAAGLVLARALAYSTAARRAAVVRNPLAATP